MVYEFPELQGLMGRYYSDAAGLPPEVGAACQEHYSPLGPSDDVPSAAVSVTVALADKIDTLTGFWAIDEKPTGSKDPFALRRAALGVIRLVLENGLQMPLDRFIDLQLVRHKGHLIDGVSETDVNNLIREIAEHGVFGAAYRALKTQSDGATDGLDAMNGTVPDKSVDLLSFFHDRLKVYLRDQGVRHDVIDACLGMPGNNDLALLVKRAKALQAVLDTEDGENLVQGFKRANNILTQAEDKDGVEYSFGADPKFAEDPTEKALFDALAQAEAKIAPAMKEQDFSAAMAAMADLRGPVDAFFEAVQVNADSEVLRRNRLNLLSTIRSTCLQVADLTRIEG
jgi:glycyl-tRNA synthetase beta chain